MLEAMLVNLRHSLVLTLQHALQKLGPVPDHHVWIKRVLREGDYVQIPALGCYLEQAIKDGNWSILDKARQEFAKRNPSWEEFSDAENGIF